MRANYFFYTVLALAGISLGLLAGGLFNLSMHLLPLPEAWMSLCGKLFAVVADLGYSSFVVGYPLLWLIAVSLGLGGRTLWVSVWNTQRLVQSLAYPRLRVYPPTLQAVASRLGLAQHIDLVSSPRWYAFCYGYLRPRVCLTTGLVAALDEAELEAVLTYERRHLENRDPLKLLLAESFRSALFFLPLLRDLSDDFRRWMEFDADQSAIRDCGDVTMASAICKLLKGSHPVRLEGHLAVGALGITAERIDQIINPRARRPRPVPWSRLLITLTVLVVLVLVGVPLDRDRSLAVASSAPATSNSEAPACMPLQPVRYVPMSDHMGIHVDGGEE